MAIKTEQPRFVLFPFLAQGHMIPMIDIARLLAKRGVIVTIITTPLNANRFKPVISRAIESGLQIQVIEIKFPCVEAGLPEGCENFDMLPSWVDAMKFFTAALMLQPSVEQILEEMKPTPSCLISDMCYPWTTQVALKFNIPRIVFHGTCCFALLCINIFASGDIDHITSTTEYFEVPGLPGRIEMTKAQISGAGKEIPKEWIEFQKKLIEAEEEAYGVVANTFEDLEKEYIEEYRNRKGKKVWCIGPVSLCNKEQSDKAERGNKATIDGKHCLNWLDSWQHNTVIYACLGSLSRLGTSQLMELGLGLESTHRPFIWVIREPSKEFKKWLQEENFEERIKPRGLIIHGWAPQVLILSHPSVGGFLTHCGWNSTMEGISNGLPMITWPVLAEQFVNQKLIVDVLKVGVSVGVEIPVWMGDEEEVGVLVSMNDVKMGVEKLMDEGDEGESRRKRAKQLGEKARRVVEEGGSSDLSITQLIHDITNWKNPKSAIPDQDSIL